MAVGSVSGHDPRAITAQFQPRAEQVAKKVSREGENKVRDGPEPRPETTQAAVEPASELSARKRAGTRLRIDEATERIVAQIIGPENEVIRQIPPEEQLRIIAKTRSLLGLLFDRLA